MNEKFAKEGARLVKLRATLKARDGIAGYKDTCDAIRAEIAKLEAASSFLGNSTSSTDSDDAPDVQPVA
jgi:hypothetical protein